MNNEKEIMEMRNVLVPIALFSNVEITEAAIALSRAGYGNVKQAVKEFAEIVIKRAYDKAIFQQWYDDATLGGQLIGMDALKCVIDNLITELYGEGE